jgi:hypothetical protein
MDWAKMSHNDRRKAVAVAAGIDSWSVEDVFDDAIVYRDNKAQGEPMMRRSFAVDGEGNITLGAAESVTPHTEYDTVTAAAFSLGDVRFSGEDVVYEGKVFECGDYQDKNFSLTEEEAQQAAANFAPVNNDLEHLPTVLSNKLGTLSNVVAKGRELFGKITVPKWFYDSVGGKVNTSLAWDRSTKRIIGNGLVVTPRIPDAQLVAAFNAANTPQGGSNMPNPNWFEKLKALFSKKELPEGFEDFDPNAVTFSEPLAPAATTTTPAAPADGDDCKEARFTALQDQNTGLQAALLQTRAESFFSEALTAGKVFPAEKEALIAQFKQAAKDDNAGSACFSADGALNEGTRIKSLKDSVNARPSHGLTTERLENLQPGDVVTMSASGTNRSEETPTPLSDKPSEARIERLAQFSGVAQKEGK